MIHTKGKYGIRKTGGRGGASQLAKGGSFMFDFERFRLTKVHKYLKPIEIIILIASIVNRLVTKK